MSSPATLNEESEWCWSAKDCSIRRFPADLIFSKLLILTNADYRPEIYGRPIVSEAIVKTPFISVLLFLIASLLGAVGQFLYKSGAESAGRSFSSYLLNARILGGVVCYTAVMFLFVVAFRKGGALSVLYPVYATTFIWAAIIGLIAYGTPIKLIHVGGMAFLLLGMYLMGK